MKLAVGDAVVYPAYGAGRVAAREKRVVLGAEQEVVVLELADGLSVTLPMQLARKLLRPLVSEAGLSRVQETLRAQPGRLAEASEAGAGEAEGRRSAGACRDRA